MNCQLYLALVGPVKAVASFANAVNMPRAVVEELGSKVTDGLTKDWQWRTPRQAARTEFPEDSIALLLQESEFLLDEINKRSHELFAVLTMICQYEEHERASGC